MNERSFHAGWNNMATPVEQSHPRGMDGWNAGHGTDPYHDGAHHVHEPGGYFTGPAHPPVYPAPYPAYAAPGHAPYGAAPHGYPPHMPPQPHAASSGKPPLSSNTVFHALGAVLSVALLIGGAAWVWQLMQRDVAGVPVVRALEGPLREAPLDAGGRQAAHQGLSINGITGVGATDEAQSEEIVLAPAPDELPLEDVILPPQEPREPAPESTRETTDPVLAALQQDVAQPDRASESLGIVSPTPRAVSTSPRPPKRDDAAAQTRLAARAAPSSGSSDAADDLASSVASSVASGLTRVRDIDIDPATLGPGTRLVQLGAYDDPEAARAAWDQLARRFAPLLDDRGRVIEAAHSGGSVFYRLRAHGFQDERDARRFCAGLVDQQIDCIPVLIR